MNNGTINWEYYPHKQIYNSDLMIKFSGDSTLIVTSESRRGDMHKYNNLKVFECSTFKLISQIENIIDEDIIRIHISPNNKWVMYITLNRIIKVFEINKMNNPPVLEFVD